jgi:hypothetical protein
MFDFIFDFPLVITGLVIVGLLCLFAIAGLCIIRRYVLPRLHIESEDGHLIATMVHSVMVFYGLAVALLAVNVFETYADVSKIVSGEATTIAMLYRDVSSYPEPNRNQMQNQLRNYMEYTINKAWPLQHRGQMPDGGVELTNRFQSTLTAFEPATEGQKLLHEETLRAYNQMIEARRLRLDAVKTALPGIMWMVIILGAFIGLTSTFFFKVKDRRLHAILVMLLAIFVGLIVFMIFAFDRPFRGDLGISSEPYQLIYDQLMKN